jgi:hypothetical protein
MAAATCSFLLFDDDRPAESGFSGDENAHRDSLICFSFFRGRRSAG